MHDQFAAEEIASEAFLKTWKHHANFKDVAGLRSYLYQVVRHDCYRYKKRKATRELKEEVIIEMYPNVESHFETILKTETIRELHDSLSILPAVCKKVFELMYIEGKTVKEISKILSLSPSTIKTHKARGLAILRK